MVKEEVSFVPQGLITCFLNDKEVRILKISKDTLTVRVSEKENIQSIKVCFYKFNKYSYEKISIKNFKILKEEEEEFCIKYVILIDSNEFSINVKESFNSYSKYIMLKNFGEENEFSQHMVGYPNDKDFEFYRYYFKQKKNWMESLNYEESENIDVELAVKLDNDVYYKEYINRDIQSFKEYYYKENFIKNAGVFKTHIKRIYIGNEFCHNLFPGEKLLMEIINKTYIENLNITLCFTYLRECYIEKNKNIIEKVYDFCTKNNKKIEIVINDWGMIKLLQGKEDYFNLVLGVLLNKRKKDPRYLYKKGCFKERERLGKNSLNSKDFREFLKEYNINRYEYESCGYDIDIPEGKSSLQVPFYVTNTSQYCPLYAVCKNRARGKQVLVKSCEKYCREYVFMYPKHLKMVGRYNSLFAFDDTILRDADKLKNYFNKGIDRLVLNFI